MSYRRTVTFVSTLTPSVSLRRLGDIGIAAVLCLLLAACGSSSDPTGGTDEDATDTAGRADGGDVSRDGETADAADAGDSGGGSDTDVSDASDDGGQDTVDADDVGPACGDGVLDEDEECDDGNTERGDGCSADCVVEECGDGVLQLALGEECDGAVPGGVACADFDFDAGTLSCSDECQLVLDGCRDIECGDGITDAPESCDDGNTEDGDGCSADCESESCGDGVRQEEIGEACDGDDLGDLSCLDFGFDRGTVSCTESCTVATDACRDVICGDGITDPGEGCDDGNREDGDGCSAECESESCGDGIRQEEIGEGCDGDDLGEQACSDFEFETGTLACDDSCSIDTTGCRDIVCGDGFVDGAEACDDGNVVDGDGCSASCAVEICGDGAVNNGDAEECDGSDFLGQACEDFGPAGGALACNEDCTIDTSGCREIECGDGFVDGDEDCDDENDETEACRYGATECTVCREGCTLGAGITSFCGDGELDEENGESCDDGNTDTEACAYGEEECTVCAADCTETAGATSFCGDGELDEGNGEGCDDGNEVSGDGCSAECTVEFCGDGLINDTDEACDGTNLGDATCVSAGFEAGALACADDCTFDTRGCRMIECGDAFTDGDETCDDGNDVTDACEYGETSCTVCTEDCQNGPGIASFCGDGETDASNGETCDDDNAVTETCAYGETACTVCDASCNEVAGATSFCGDGETDASNGETCDDGNAVTEACDYGETSCTVCTADCSEGEGATSFCGDGSVDEDNGEVCDDGDDNSDVAADACRLDCTPAQCGDNVVDEGETCDDGNLDPTDACTSECLRAECGDGFVRAGLEQCDDGDDNDDEAPDACRTTCVAAFCGDGVLDSDEECDLGGENGPDAACTAECRVNLPVACAGETFLFDSDEDGSRTPNDVRLTYEHPVATMDSDDFAPPEGCDPAGVFEATADAVLLFRPWEIGAYEITTNLPATFVDTAIYALDGCSPDSELLACNDDIEDGGFGGSTIEVELDSLRPIYLVVEADTDEEINDIYLKATYLGPYQEAGDSCDVDDENCRPEMICTPVDAEEPVCAEASAPTLTSVTPRWVDAEAGEIVFIVEGSDPDHDAAGIVLWEFFDDGDESIGGGFTIGFGRIEWDGDDFVAYTGTTPVGDPDTVASVDVAVRDRRLVDSETTRVELPAREAPPTVGAGMPCDLDGLTTVCTEPLICTAIDGETLCGLNQPPVLDEASATRIDRDSIMITVRGSDPNGDVDLWRAEWLDATGDVITNNEGEPRPADDLPLFFRSRGLAEFETSRPVSWELLAPDGPIKNIRLWLVDSDGNESDALTFAVPQPRRVARGRPCDPLVAETRCTGTLTCGVGLYGDHVCEENAAPEFSSGLTTVERLPSGNLLIRLAGSDINGDLWTVDIAPWEDTNRNGDIDPDEFLFESVPAADWTPPANDRYVFDSTYEFETGGREFSRVLIRLADVGGLFHHPDGFYNIYTVGAPGGP